MHDAYPLKRRTGALVEEMTGETVVYIPEDEAVHVLNGTARVVWNLCDGSHDARDLERALRASFVVSDHVDVYHDVEQVLHAFATKQLIEPARNAI